MLLHTFDVLLQEVPGEVSLTFFIAGCPVRCKGCHSPVLWTDKGIELTAELYNSYLTRYQSLATCVLFMGGEWDDQLTGFLAQAKAAGLKTALYSGYDISQLQPSMLEQLDYLKHGPWIADLGGLSAPGTNQRFIHVPSGRCMNELFQR